uniref:C3H1-type domain-containing protein n=1 Tax=Trichogramma kaykai TaxID=54128 RepID=A0ABD2WIV8_9HYME
MAMVNMNNLINGKDSRWLQLEVCREFQRQKCTRPDTECKFAHPPANVEVQNGRVTACYDSIKYTIRRDGGSGGGGTLTFIGVLAAAAVVRLTGWWWLANEKQRTQQHQQHEGVQSGSRSVYIYTWLPTLPV